MGAHGGVKGCFQKNKVVISSDFQDVRVLCKILSQSQPANKRPHCLQVVYSSSSSSSPQP